MSPYIETIRLSLLSVVIDETTLETGGEDAENTLETGGEDDETTLETGGEDACAVRDQALEFFTRFECSFCDGRFDIFEFSTLYENSLYENLIRLAMEKPCEAKVIFPTRFECSFTSFPPVSSVVLHLLHSFRV